MFLLFGLTIKIKAENLGFYIDFYMENNIISGFIWELRSMG
jgi:hypothetical protein